MTRPAPLLLLFLLVCRPAAGQADTAELDALRAEVAAMRAELDALRAEPGGWTAAAREQEVRRIVDEAVEAADGDGAAGHDGKRFFLGDDAYRLQIEGLLQFRHVYLNDDGGGGGDDLSGFEVRRARLAFSGNVIDEKLTYFVQLENARDGGDTFLLDAIASYEFGNGVKLQAGRFKLPFLYEQLLSAKRQLGVDRAQSTQFFTLGRSEQVQLVVPATDRLRLSGAFSDGGNRDGTGALNDASDWAFTARAQGRLVGDWKDLESLVAWDQPTALFVGAAGHAQDNRGAEDLTAWTADAVLLSGRLAAMAAYAGASGGDFEAHGLVVQAGFSATQKLQPFARYDLVDADGTDTLHAVTAGANWFFAGQAAKLTADVVYVLDAPAGFGADAPAGLGNGAFGSGIGLAAPGDGDQLSVRTQLQLLF